MDLLIAVGVFVGIVVLMGINNKLDYYLYTKEVERRNRRGVKNV